MVTDPPTGKIPPLTPEAQKKQDERAEARRHLARVPADRSLSERCLIFRTDAPPMTPYAYNNNYWIVQTKDYVALYVEMVQAVLSAGVNQRSIRVQGAPWQLSTAQGGSLGSSNNRPNRPATLIWRSVSRI
jgi:hypothetical protein